MDVVRADSFYPQTPDRMLRGETPVGSPSAGVSDPNRPKGNGYLSDSEAAGPGGWTRDGLDELRLQLTPARCHIRR